MKPALLSAAVLAASASVLGSPYVPRDAELDARDDTDGWNAIVSLSPAASAVLALITGLHYEYWCTEFLPYMTTPAAYVVTTVTATVTGAASATTTTTTTTTTTITTTTKAAVAGRGLDQDGIVELPGVLAPFGKKAVAEACSAVFRPGPRATTTTVVVGGTATETATVTETCAVTEAV